MSTFIIRILLLFIFSPFLFPLISFCAPKSTSLKKGKKEPIVKLSTSFGDIYLMLFDETPIHKDNFVKLVKEGFYNGTSFHRVINGFMIQAGDPNSKEGGDENQIGKGGPGYTLPSEIVENFKHSKGYLAAARQADIVNPEKRSSGSQFYIVQGENGAHHLDGEYTIFGKVIEGMDVIDKIAGVEVNNKKRPKEAIFISAEVIEFKSKKLAKKFDL